MKMPEALQELIAKLKKIAPPDPDEKTLTWFEAVYRGRRTLGPDRSQCIKFAQTQKWRAGDPLLRTLFEGAAAPHHTDRTLGKYAKILTRALQQRVHSRDLKKFIEDEGGINRASRHSRPRGSKNRKAP